MNRSKLILAVIGAIALLGSAFFIHRAVSVSAKAREGKDARDRAFSDLEKVYKDEIFPSQANVATVKDDVARYEGVRDSFASALAAKNVQPPASRITPSAFMQTLQAFVAAKIKAAPSTAGRSCVSDDFAFGFDRYIGAPVMPQNDEVPRLVQQLLITKDIVDVLFAAHIVELRSMTREVFEGVQATAQPKPAQPDEGARGGPGRRNAPGRQGRAANAKQGGAAASAPEEPLFTSQRFTVSFVADEHAVLTVLNDLARLGCFAVVSDVRISKSASDIRPPETSVADAPQERPRRDTSRRRRTSRRGEDDEEEVAPSVPAPAPKELTLAQRLMTGPDIDPPLEVSLVIDVYSFRAVKAGKEAE